MAVTKQPGYVEAFVKIAAKVAREAYAMDKQDWTLLTAQYTSDACFETSTDFGELPAAVQAMLDKGVCGHDAIVKYVKIAGLWRISESTYERVYEQVESFTEPPNLTAHWLARVPPPAAAGAK